MKKKIVYISGAEVFDVNDVRAAFDEVRNALKLGPDTILFGVPVDADEEAFANAELAKNAEPPAETDNLVNTESVAEPAKEVTEPTEIVETVEIVAETEPEPVIEEPVVMADEPKSDTKDSVVPILSILASKEDEPAQESANEEVKEDKVKEPKAKTKKAKSKKVVAEPEPIPEPEPISEPEIESESFEDPEEDMSEILNDEMPTAPSEKTLEELLETMEPLREDVTGFHEKNHANDAPITTSEEIDVTLEKLAGEFAENQDKMPLTKKSSERGKIGKLKSILPFKKMKRDDSGLMGDLFGWAGIAANDDDFTMPGFFK